MKLASLVFADLQMKQSHEIALSRASQARTPMAQDLRNEPEPSLPLVLSSCEQGGCVMVNRSLLAFHRDIPQHAAAIFILPCLSATRLFGARFKSFGITRLFVYTPG